MTMIKICKKPFIIEDEDRWAQPLGTYSVLGSEVGMVEESFWNDLKLFENYDKTPEGIAEQEKAIRDLKAGKAYDQLDMPIIKSLFSRSNGILWQFNMLVDVSPDNMNNTYVRSYASFNRPTFREWTPQHDEEVKRLEEKCQELNGVK